MIVPASVVPLVIYRGETLIGFCLEVNLTARTYVRVVLDGQPRFAEVEPWVVDGVGIPGRVLERGTFDRVEYWSDTPDEVRSALPPGSTPIVEVETEWKPWP